MTPFHRILTAWTVLSILTLGALPATGQKADPTQGTWPSWGGVNGDFRTGDPGLALPWTEDSRPEELWRRPLGEGYSTIAAAGDRLYVLFAGREADGLPHETVAALDAATGRAVWETSYPAPRPSGMRLNHGEGPHAQPTLVSTPEADLVVTVGTTGLLHALDRASGEIVWSTDLWDEHGAERLRRGYGSSPLVHEVDGRQALLVPAGGERQGMIAFDATNGEVLWRSPPIEAAQSSPLLVTHGDAAVVVLFVRDAAVALDPTSGEILWRTEHSVLGPYNITTPARLDVASAPALLLTSAYGGGTRRIDLSADLTSATSTWHDSKIGVHFTNVEVHDGFVVLSNGRSSPYVTALDTTTGELLWRDRAIGRANFLTVGEHHLALEESGRLVAFRADREGVEVVSEQSLFDERCWSAPTLTGDVLYVRTRSQIAAFRLPTSP